MDTLIGVHFSHRQDINFIKKEGVYFGIYSYKFNDFIFITRI